MSDKFDSMSIYDVDWKMTDPDGIEHEFTFKPLPFKHYPKMYSVVKKLQDMSFDEKLPEDEQVNKFLESIDEETIIELNFLEKEMVKKSYPSLPEDKVELFVQSNTFDLIPVLLQLLGKSEKADKRRTDMAKNELQAKS